jgi:hypothetical protein
MLLRGGGDWQRLYVGGQQPGNRCEASRRPGVAMKPRGPADACVCGRGLPSYHGVLRCAPGSSASGLMSPASPHPLSHCAGPICGACAAAALWRGVRITPRQQGIRGRPEQPARPAGGTTQQVPNPFVSKYVRGWRNEDGKQGCSYKGGGYKRSAAGGVHMLGGPNEGTSQPATQRQCAPGGSTSEGAAPPARTLPIRAAARRTPACAPNPLPVRARGRRAHKGRAGG